MYDVALQNRKRFLRKTLLSAIDRTLLPNTMRTFLDAITLKAYELADNSLQSITSIYRVLYYYLMIGVVS
jgi:hypothetical protein